MSARGRRGGERGTTLIEVVVAAAVLFIAMIGFVQMSAEAAMATALGHRRTMATFLRGEVLDRLTVLPRSSPALTQLASYTSVTQTDPNAYGYVIDTCYAVDGHVLSSNVGYLNPSYACGVGTVYQSHVAARDTGNSTWSIGVFVERVDQGCSASSRYNSWGCSAADLLLTD